MVKMECARRKQLAKGSHGRKEKLVKCYIDDGDLCCIETGEAEMEVKKKKGELNTTETFDGSMWTGPIESP